MTVTDAKRDTYALWAALLAGPVVWAVQFQAVYALAAWAGDGGPQWTLYVVSLFALLAAAGGGYVGGRAWRALGGWPSGSGEPDLNRARLMAALAMTSGLLFAIVIFAQWVAMLMLPPYPGRT